MARASHPNAGGWGSIPGQGTSSHVWQLRLCAAKLRNVYFLKLLKIVQRPKYNNQTHKYQRKAKLTSLDLATDSKIWHQKSWATTKKEINWTFSILEFFASKDTIKRAKDRLQNERKYLQIKYLMGKLYLEYLKNTYNSTIRQSNEKFNRGLECHFQRRYRNGW